MGRKSTVSARITFPPAVRLRAAGVKVRPAAADPDRWKVWHLTWRRDGGPARLATIHVPTPYQCTASLDLLVMCPPDCADLWAAVVDAAGYTRAPSVWSPVILVDPDRHDPARGHIAPSRFPRIVLE